MRVRIPIAATLAAVMAVSSFGINAASAAPVAPLPAAAHSVADDGQVIQVASKKKKRYRSNNNAAAAAAFAGIAGAMIGLAAQESRRDRYYDRRGYYHGRSYGYAPRYRQHNVYRGNPGYYYGNRGNPVRSGPRTGLLPNNLPVGNDPLNADPYGR